MQTVLNGGKLAHKDLVPDMNVTATLRMSLAIQEAMQKNQKAADDSFETDE